MAPTRPPPNLAELLTHADWVKSLARELVRDEHRAEDVVQETWIAALRHGPSTVVRREREQSVRTSFPTRD
jgi:DNA-directed RNA polymerase specialized sigma24 family protein